MIIGEFNPSLAPLAPERYGPRERGKPTEEYVPPEFAPEPEVTTIVDPLPEDTLPDPDMPPPPPPALYPAGSLAVFDPRISAYLILQPAAGLGGACCSPCANGNPCASLGAADASLSSLCTEAGLTADECQIIQQVTQGDPARELELIAAILNKTARTYCDSYVKGTGILCEALARKVTNWWKTQSGKSVRAVKGHYCRDADHLPPGHVLMDNGWCYKKGTGVDRIPQSGFPDWNGKSCAELVWELITSADPFFFLDYPRSFDACTFQGVPFTPSAGEKSLGGCKTLEKDPATGQILRLRRPRMLPLINEKAVTTSEWDISQPGAKTPHDWSYFVYKNWLPVRNRWGIAACRDNKGNLTEFGDTFVERPRSAREVLRELLPTFVPPVGVFDPGTSGEELFEPDTIEYPADAVAVFDQASARYYILTPR